MLMNLVAVGRMKSGPERELVSRYLDRATACGKPLALSGFEVRELPESRASSAQSRKVEEATAIGSKLPETGYLIVLDERGKSVSSKNFASIIEKQRDAGTKAMSFVIGGADGLDKSLRTKADMVLSFSPLTWPHQIVRLLLAEQLYRATTILSGHPYHRS